LIINELIMKL